MFQTRNIYIKKKMHFDSFIHTQPVYMMLFFLVFAARISLLFFSSRGARGHALIMVNDPFSDLPLVW